MMIPMTSLALVAQLTFTIADVVPRLNVEPVCRGIAQQGGLGLDLEPNQTAQQNFKSCVTSEMIIRGKLVKLWPTFKAATKANCIGEANAGGLSSYTDLLTCLQMTTEAGKMNH
jgi:hypothetical protein